MSYARLRRRATHARRIATICAFTERSDASACAWSSAYSAGGSRSRNRVASARFRGAMMDNMIHDTIAPSLGQWYSDITYESEQGDVMRIPADDWKAVCERWGGRCAYCGTTERRLIPEHVEPMSRGGADSMANIVPACQSCNSSKGDLFLLEWVLVQRYVLVRQGAGNSYRNLRTYESWSAEVDRNLRARDDERERKRLAKRRPVEMERLNIAGHDILRVSGWSVGRIDLDVSQVLAALNGENGGEEEAA